MKIKEIAFFCYPVTDMTKAKAFYEGILGLKSTSNWEDKFIEYDIGNATLAIGVGSQFKPNAGGGNAAFEVEDFESAVETLKKHNVNIVVEPMDCGPCQMVGVSDPDGNTMMIHKRKK